MTTEGSATGSDLVGRQEAANLLEVAEDRIDIMVEEGLLTPVEQDGTLRFMRAEILGLRELGG